jgi:hypothetical protein
VGPFSSCFCELSNMDRVKSGSYLMALSVLVFGITTFAGFGCSFGLAGAGLFSNGFVAVFAVSCDGAATSGFLTGSAFAGAGFVVAFVATVLTGAAVTFLAGAGAGFLTSTFLGATLAFVVAFAAGFAGALAAGFALDGAAAFTTLAGAFLAGVAFAGADLTAFLGGAAFPAAFFAGLVGSFFAGWAALPDFLDATFFVAIRLLPFF